MPREFSPRPRTFPTAVDTRRAPHTSRPARGARSRGAGKARLYRIPCSSAARVLRDRGGRLPRTGRLRSPSDTAPSPCRRTPDRDDRLEGSRYCPRGAIGAAAASVGRLPLLAVFVDVADEHPALYAGVGAQALETGVVCLYGVVVILGRWVRAGCARLCGVHKLSPYGPGSGVRQHPRGHFLS